MTASVAQQNAALLDSVNADLERVAQHQAAGRYREADIMLDRLLTAHPGVPRLLHLKALNHSYRGDRDTAISMLETVVDNTEPSDPVALVDLGTILAQSGQMDAAIERLKRATEIAPNLALAHGNLGAALLTKSDLPGAIRHLQKAVSLDGTILDVLLNLGQAHIRAQQFDAAIDVLFRALSVDPQNAPAHSHLAHALFRRERPDSAEHHARRAMELAPGQPEPMLHLGNTLAAQGKIAEAVDMLLGIANKPPVGIAALTRVVHIRKTTADSPEYNTLKTYESRLDSIAVEPRTALLFALGKAEDDLGNYEAAIGYFNAANALATAQQPRAFGEDNAAERTERLLEFVTPALLSRCASKTVTEVSPIFICGMPRSGTTLMDQMFSRHPDVQAGGELPATIRALGRNKRLHAALEKDLDSDALTPDDFARLAEDYVAVLHGEGLRAGYVSDKMPANYHYVPLLAMALPRAKFLIMRRHPMDNLLSNYMQNFGANQPFSTAFPALGATWRRFDALASRWAELLPDRVRQVAYEDIVTDPEARMRELVAFVGLDWSPAMLDHTASSHQVNTASVAQVRQPIYDSSVARWRRYGPLLKNLAIEVQDALSDEDRVAAGLDPRS
ncbi:tetratricopeptide repeat-containing sulfotransferase family protein [Tropicibacter sp. S64]|uniref:tetratricopeptide repeat-containing sulfotransferase family protein n=1 Tax=Tropicibacter sp. S64 TaxID=3415122 RepID=UPI003C7A3B75